MNGVPADLPVEAFIGREVMSIVLTMHQIFIHFDGGAEIRIGGSWQLLDAGEKVIDQDCDPPAGRESFRIHRLLAQPVRAASIDPPRSFTLTFENGDALTILDDSDGYESFSVHIDGREFYV